jgi:hypothetical protein
MSDITITLCNPQTGQSESIPVADTLTISELIAILLHFKSSELLDDFL